ncbi:Hypothetical protein MCYN_0038 [Mycoplasmopsis cynos C142]|uniref:Uncharacterized protein n=1 Tax=Mycoplasmopsis cynos (strain C142) TaxID=1246955 RepID=L0RW30_MYCC1|nr:Hypothetical protein MCYN_0038 [Mycoplasmopsis cynos C142]
MRININVIKNAETIPVIEPSNVFLGLIIGANLFLKYLWPKNIPPK